MKYEKPQLHALTTALEAIQSDQVKLIHRVLDSSPMPPNLGATAAYEADE